MNHDLAVFRSININGSSEDVWDALTNPEKIKQYLYGTECICEWTIGSDIIFKGEYEGQTYHDHGEIVDIILGQKLEYTYWSGFSGLEDKPNNYSLVTFEIEDLNSMLILKVTQKGYASEANQEHSNAGWETILKTIKGIVEKTF